MTRILFVLFAGLVLFAPRSVAATPGDGAHFALDEHEERIAFTTGDGRIVVWHRALAEVVLELRAPASVDRVMWAGDTLVASSPGELRAWRVSAGELLCALPVGGALALSPDGQLVATHRLLLDVSTGLPVRAWPHASEAAFAEDGSAVATLHGADATLRRLSRERSE